VGKPNELIEHTQKIVRMRERTQEQQRATLKTDHILPQQLKLSQQ
jgi:hypothetical protein